MEFKLSEGRVESRRFRGSDSRNREEGRECENPDVARGKDEEKKVWG